MLSDTARQRRRELAIRLALGAQQWRILCQVLSEGGRLAGAGVLTGVPAALLLWRLFGHILPVSGPPAFWAWLAGPVVLGLMVILAGVLPARRALALNPITILREEK